jgi:hypothetical protein
MNPKMRLQLKQNISPVPASSEPMQMKMELLSIVRMVGRHELFCQLTTVTEAELCARDARPTKWTEQSVLMRLKILFASNSDSAYFIEQTRLLFV